MPSETAHIFDVAIIGGGPAGLSAALLLGRACRRVALIDDGQPRNAAARELHGYLSRDGVRPQQLLSAGHAEAAKYGVHALSDRVIGVERKTQPCGLRLPTAFAVTTQQGQQLVARKILFATGIHDDVPAFPGLRECYGATVHHCPYCDGWEHRGKRLLAYGETPGKAVGLGLALRAWSGQVTVLTHGKQASTDDARRLTSNGIALVEERVLRIMHQGDRLHGVEFEEGEAVPADALFFSTSKRAGSSLPRELGCDTDGNSFAQTGEKQKTNVPGVYLAGDADADVQFAIVAAGEGATAAVAINRELQEEDQCR